jgi:superfamily II DNA or RNA helicase/HKD family nuclease
MNLLLSDLGESLKTGFLDLLVPCKKEYLPHLLVNDSKTGRKVLTTILKELKECEEFWFSVAFVTKGGVATIIDTLKELEEKDIKGKILVSQYQNFTEPEALRTLLGLKNIELKIAVHGNFHAKGYLFKKNGCYTLAIGSSNLTDRALCANKEWNLKICATESSSIIVDALAEFNSEFKSAVPVDNSLINSYEVVYKQQKMVAARGEARLELEQHIEIVPNSMQVEALANLKKLRGENKDRALLISATATGKTFLSAFDVKNVDAQKCLFVVHRANIAATAMRSFRKIFGNKRVFGMYSGDRKEIEADFLFSTIQTISKDNHLNQFDKHHFDYIIIDETHRAGAESYQKIINYFKPKFLLGMTATPERTDGFNIFKQFNYDIAYEIRLQKALEEEMLCPFHYYGVTDVVVNERSIKEDVAFNLLISEERVNKIIEKANLYGCDNGCVRGLVFCSGVTESLELSNIFNRRGYKTIALSGGDTEKNRADAILQLEHSDEKEKLDYIFTVDIFNEGVDIPKVNQIILLRPTQSAIVFVQQLGRGLRKADNKAYLTVIDFIANYSNNYLVPIALFGDTSYSKDTLRKLMTNGSSLIPGASTVNFDRIARERIYKAIDSANLSLRKDLAKDYQLLKFEIGRIPMMVDFIEHGSRDPFLYVEYARSYFNFAAQEEESLQKKLSKAEIKLIELFSNYISDAKRIEEVLIVKELLSNNSVTTTAFKKIVLEKYGTSVSDATIQSCIKNLNFEFINAPEKIVRLDGDSISFENSFLALLKNDAFKLFIEDTLNYAQTMYETRFNKSYYVDGFILYQKYSRRDVCRILNWERDEHSTMYGYKVKNGTCPIFVNYHKEEDIVSTTKYNDRFVNNYEFEWMSRSRRTLESKEIVDIQNYKNGLRLSLFVKKSNDEGNDFYYIGDVTPIKFEETTMPDDAGKPVSVVKVNFSLNQPVEDAIYDYLLNKSL